MGERIGILGGTFDPIHVAHLALAVQARDQLALDRLLLVVANVPWQKAAERRISDPEVRFEMVAAAVAGHPGLEASRIELDRGGDSFTVDTLHQLAAPGRALFLVIGSDLVGGLTTWKRWEELPGLCTLAVAYRPTEAEQGEPLPGWPAVPVHLPALELSSTELRAMVAEGRPVDFLVPAPAIEVIVRQNLYRPPAPQASDPATARSQP